MKFFFFSWSRDVNLWRSWGSAETCSIAVVGDVINEYFDSLTPSGEQQGIFPDGHRISVKFGRSTNHHDDTEKVVWKCTLPQPFLDYSSSFNLENELSIFWNQTGWRTFGDGKKKNEKICRQCSRLPYKLYKRWHVTCTLLIGRERVRNVKKLQTHVQSVQNYFFSLFDMQICDDIFAVLVVIAWAS